ELSERLWWSANQADIIESFCNEQMKLVFIEEAAYISFIMGIAFCFLLQFPGYAVNFIAAILFRHLRSKLFENLRGYIFNADEESYRLAGVRELLFTGHCPKTITKVIMFNAGMI